MKPLSFTEFLEQLKAKHEKVYPKQWSNYPNSIFYYDIPNATSSASEVGIYTNEEHYYIKD